jgi:hypothetical protein
MEGVPSGKGQFGMAWRPTGWTKLECLFKLIVGGILLEGVAEKLEKPFFRG